MKWLTNIFRKSQKIDLNFNKKFKYFQNLIKANDLAHKAMSEMGEMIVSAKPFSRSYANNIYINLIANTRIIVDNLIKMSGGNYSRLRNKLEKIEDIGYSILHPKHYCPLGFDCPDMDCHICTKMRLNPEEVKYYYDINEITDSDYIFVGDKMSRLGEIKNVLGLPVPEGFSLSVRLFEEIIMNNNIRGQKDKIFADLDFSDIAQIRDASQKTQNLFISNPIPQNVKDKILEAFDSKFSLNSNIKLAVRSSALGEDSDKYSFAGLHHTILNVPRENLIDACYEVLISKYSPESVVYRFVHGLRDEDMPMSVCCLKMVDAAAAGVLFTSNPNPGETGMIIQAVKGLGLLVVEGRVTPQEFIVEHNDKPTILSFKQGNQKYQNVLNQKGGLSKDYLSENESLKPCLTNEQIKTLVRYALIMEKHFSTPLDIEWALDKQGKIYILQARPLIVKNNEKNILADFSFDDLEKKYSVLLKGGETASPGISSGVVKVVNTPDDFINFPRNGIIVAKKNVPEFASLIHKAVAVITDFGSTTGHLAIIARELGVPILTNTYKASSILKDNMEVTIDANNGYVFEGIVQELIEYNEKNENKTEKFRNSSLYNIWHRLSKFIFKLNIYNPDTSNFNVEGCETVHDIIRFAHEKAMKLMFSLSQNAQTSLRKAYNLRFSLPLDIDIIDLNDGLKEISNRNWITPEQIQSEPFNALLKGMLTPGLKWSGHLPIDTKGFASIILGNIVDNSRHDSEIGGKNYALISKNYFNFFSRLGYHFTRIDCFASDELNSNYINFNFRGGAANMVRKVRRINAIKLILEHYGFTVEVYDDNCMAKIRKIPRDTTINFVQMLGRLMGAIRNTDVSMTSNKQVEIFVKYFLEGDPTPASHLVENK